MPPQQMPQLGPFSGQFTRSFFKADDQASWSWALGDSEIPDAVATLLANATFNLVRQLYCSGRRREGTTMRELNTSNWDKFSKRIVLGLIVSAVVAAVFLLLGIYIVGAEQAMP
jgi:hypothetical protein